MFDLLPAIGAEEQMDCLVADLGCVLQIVADHLADLGGAIWKVHEDCGLASDCGEVLLDRADD